MTQSHNDILQQGAAFLENQRHKHMSRDVLYQRGAERVALWATVGSTSFEQVDDFGIVQRFESRDYMVRSIDLVFGGASSEPVAGDLVRDPFGDVDHVYEVVAPSGETPFRYSDPQRLTIRIHTKFIGEEPRL